MINHQNSKTNSKFQDLPLSKLKQNYPMSIIYSSIQKLNLLSTQIFFSIIKNHSILQFRYISRESSNQLFVSDQFLFIMKIHSYFCERFFGDKY
jgi:hypothetical protein